MDGNSSDQATGGLRVKKNGKGFSLGGARAKLLGDLTITFVQAAAVSGFKTALGTRQHGQRI